MAISLVSLIIFMPLFTNLCHAEPRTELIERICGKERVQNVSNYFKYYSRIADYMQDEMYRNKFAFKDVGKPPDRLHVLSQCMDDLSADECVVCFTQINTLIPGCFPATGGRVYLDGCFIRAENYSFYREALGDQDTKICGTDANTGREFREAVEKVLEELLHKAPTAGPVRRGFTTTHIDNSAYGMASCWKILDSDLCYSCLSHAVASALSCLPSTEARVLNAGCFLRYADFSFADRYSGETREVVVAYFTYILGIALVCLMAIGIGVCVGKHTYRRKNGVKEIKDEGRQFLQFKYATIQTATHNFSEVLRLGKGGFGEVYKGTLPDGREIAIKRLYVRGKSRIEEIYNEMDIISRAQHKNLVRFLGCCFTSVDSFLVYEYLPNKSLDLMLFERSSKEERTQMEKEGFNHNGNSRRIGVSPQTLPSANYSQRH